VRRVDSVKQGSDVVGNHTRVKVVKNKVAPPFKQAEFDIMYGEGVSRESSIIDIAADLEILNKSGSWYSYNGNRLGQGKDTVKELLRKDTAFMAELEAKVREMLQDPTVREALAAGNVKKAMREMATAAENE
ncbi:MAG: DNA recombination/repair protein RecA, partial [Selenomonadaceae bacterium]